MPSQSCEDSIALAIQHGNALLKVISKNDVSAKSHQAGFYLPKEPWRLFTPHPPIRGRNADFEATVLWPDGTETRSCIHWWGREKDEYHLTRFNRIRNFPWRRPEMVGDLFVLIRTAETAFAAFVFSNPDDIEEIQARLGVEVVSHWTTYPQAKPKPFDEIECIKLAFREYVATIHRLPTGRTFAGRARAAVDTCIEGFREAAPDARLLRYVRAEYELFQHAEEHIYGARIAEGFPSMKPFLDLANSILNSRKSRAGKSLESHVQHLLAESDIPFDPQARSVKGTPDIIIPSAAAYADRHHPRDRICVLGIKRTCKDRWRQVLKEAPDVQHKHILTLQEGISRAQMEEMRDERVTLVVPQALHREYPRNTGLEVLSVAQFLDYARALNG